LKRIVNVIGFGSLKDLLNTDKIIWSGSSLMLQFYFWVIANPLDRLITGSRASGNVL